jgi:hypothetical protein
VVPLTLTFAFDPTSESINRIAFAFVAVAEEARPTIVAITSANVANLMMNDDFFLYL